MREYGAFRLTRAVHKETLGVVELAFAYEQPLYHGFVVLLVYRKHVFVVKVGEPRFLLLEQPVQRGQAVARGGGLLVFHGFRRGAHILGELLLQPLVPAGKEVGHFAGHTLVVVLADFARARRKASPHFKVNAGACPGIRHDVFFARAQREHRRKRI